MIDKPVVKQHTSSQHDLAALAECAALYACMRNECIHSHARSGNTVSPARFFFFLLTLKQAKVCTDFPPWKLVHTRVWTRFWVQVLGRGSKNIVMRPQAKAFLQKCDAFFPPVTINATPHKFSPYLCTCSKQEHTRIRTHQSFGTSHAHAACIR